MLSTFTNSLKRIFMKRNRENISLFFQSVPGKILTLPKTGIFAATRTSSSPRPLAQRKVFAINWSDSWHVQYRETLQKMKRDVAKMRRASKGWSSYKDLRKRMEKAISAIENSKNTETPTIASWNCIICITSVCSNLSQTWFMEAVTKKCWYKVRNFRPFPIFCKGRQEVESAELSSTGCEAA